MDSSAPEDESLFRWERLDLALFAVFFLATLIFLPLASFRFLRLFQPDLRMENLNGIEQILIQAAMDLVLVGFILFLIARLHSQPVLRTLRWVRKEHLQAVRLIGAGAFMAITVLLVSAFFPEPGDSPIERLLTTTPSIVVFVIFGIAFAPLLEEVIFRGFLFAALADVYGFRAAVPVTAVLFAGLHVSQLRGNWPAVLVIFLVGYVLTLVRQRTNSLIPSVIMHTAYNAMIFGISALATLLGSPTQP